MLYDELWETAARSALRSIFRLRSSAFMSAYAD